MIIIFINDLSFNGQAANEEEAKVFLRELHQALHKLQTTLGSSQVHRPRSIKDAYISKTLKFGEFLSKSILPQQLRVTLLTYILKGPYIDMVKDEYQYILRNGHECKYNGKSYTETVLAYAAHCSSKDPFYGTHRPAALLSLKNAPDFTEEQLEVEFMLLEEMKTTKVKQGKRKQKNQSPDPICTVWNVTQPQQVDRVTRKYKANDGKHAKDSKLGDYISAMDLNDKDALEVLANGVSLEDVLRDETRVFGRKNGKYYIFPRHDSINNEFHGFRVDEKAIQRQMTDVHAELKRLHFFE